MQTTRIKKPNTYKQKRLAELAIELNKCEAAINSVPDNGVNARVSMLANNPCITGMYYLNAIYKDTQAIESEEAALKLKVDVQKKLIYEGADNSAVNSMLKDFENGDNIGLGFVLQDNRYD